MTQFIEQGRSYLLEGPRSHSGKTTAAFKAAKDAGFTPHFLSVLHSPTKDRLLKNLADIIREEPNAAIVIDLHGLPGLENQEVYKALMQMIDEKSLKLKDGSTCDTKGTTLFLETRNAHEAQLPEPLLARLETFKVG